MSARVKFVLRDMWVAYEDNWPDAYEPYDDTMGLWLTIDGNPDTLMGIDGGEPEDQTFNRDWSWVPSALQTAYELGVKHGIEQIYNRYSC